MKVLPYNIDWRSKLWELIGGHSADIMAGHSTEEVMKPVIDLAIKYFKCRLVHVWSVDPRNERLVLVGQECDTALRSPTVDVIDASKSFAGLAFETRQPQVHRDLTILSDRTFCNDSLRRELGLVSCISLPIRNIGNPHQVTMVIDFCCDFKLPESLGQKPFTDEYRRYAALLAGSFESNLRERSFRMSARVSQALGRVKHLTPESGCAAFAETVREALGADWVTVFLENWNETTLVRKADTFVKSSTTNHMLNGEDSSIPHLATQVWKSNREVLLPNLSDAEQHHALSESEPVKISSAILVPLHDVRGGCKGVVRCINLARSSPDEWRRRFSYENIAIVESMERAFAPPLDMMLQSQVHDRSLSNLAHELRVPVVALKAVHERMEREYNVGKVWFKFRFPYFNEVHTFTNVMQRLLRQLEFARIGADKVDLTKQPSKLLSDVIQPALRHMEPVLRQHGMQPHQIKHSGFENLPPIDVDKGFLVQVAFNLLENMVKYFPKTKSSNTFHGNVICEKSYGRIEIVFKDNGAGIDEADKERIFEHGFRSQGAEQSNVHGTGLGCWLAREIARRHEGDAYVRSCRPFEIVLQLPHSRLRNIQGL